MRGKEKGEKSEEVSLRRGQEYLLAAARCYGTVARDKERKAISKVGSSGG